MVEERVERRLASIVAADVVGYSRLIEADEEGTLARLKVMRRDLIDPGIAAHSGRIVKTTGDGLLIEFASVVDAVQCAIEVQQAVVESQADIAEDQRLVFRIGVNVGDVVVEDDDIFGDGVNVAARLEGMADPGGVLISQPVRDSLGDHLDVRFFDNGERKFKNIARPIRVWSWPRQLSAARADSKPHVFVTDFEGRSESEQQFAADFGAEIRAHLSRLTGLEVSAERRDAHYVIEGSVRLASGRCRIFVRLNGADGARQIWSDRYNEDTDDAFDILDRCVPRLTMSVRRRVAADDAARLANRNLDELSFEELLSAAGVSFFTPTKAGWMGGGRIAEQALELAPQNFMALAMAAAGLGLGEYLYGFSRPDDAVIRTAFQRVEAALRLTNRSDMLHATQSGLLLYARRRHRDAAAAGQRALELNPDYNMGLWSLGAAQAFAGEYDTGAANAQRAVNIDVRDPYVHLYSRIAAYGHLGAGRYDEAADWFQRADQLAPALPANLIGLAVSRWLGGDADGAAEAINRLLDAAPAFSVANMQPLPYRDEATWAWFADTLCSAGAPA